MIHRHLTKNILINDMHCHTLFVLLVLLMAATKLPLEEQALGEGTKQNLSNLLFLDIYGMTQ